MQATLDSALATESQEMRDQIVNLRKNDQFSAIPWLNSRLSKLELGPQLQALIHQANLNWTAGSLMSMCLRLFRRAGICGSLEDRFHHHLLAGWILGWLHAHRLCAVQAQQALQGV